tara:strand:- start:743 stop:1390 length:648 start_codon:yes stop_codon:yes gene_type:complete
VNDLLSRINHPTLGDVVFHRISDSVPIENQNRIENHLVNNNRFCWNFNETTISPWTRLSSLDRFNDITILNHMLVSDGKKLSDDLQNLGNDIGMGKLIQTYNLSGNLLRAQANLFIKRDIESFGCPHVDVRFARHLVILYYVNDSDGDTIFYDLSINEDDRLSEMKEWRRESPNKGDILIFDGRIYHSPSCPTKHSCRSTLNFDMEIQEEYVLNE